MQLRFSLSKSEKLNDSFYSKIHIMSISEDSLKKINAYGVII